MKWKKYSIHTTTEAEDIISIMLDDLGVEGVQIENNVALTDDDIRDMFIDIPLDQGPDDGTSVVSFFLREPDGEDELSGETQTPEAGVTPEADNSYIINDRIWSYEEIDHLLSEIRRGLTEISAYTDIGEGRIEVGETEETDWRDNWKQFFKPFAVEDILIKPLWEEIPEEHAEAVADGSLKLIQMDPGAAFGTGTHETTILALQGLRKYVKAGDRVLDIGTGSGILGLAALKYGAEYVLGTDLDPVCELAFADNLPANDVTPEQFGLIIGNVIGDDEVAAKVGSDCYDIVVANILAPVIETLSKPGEADRFAKKGAIFITSGIRDIYEQEVVDTFAENPAWEVIDVLRMNDWSGVIAKRK